MSSRRSLGPDILLVLLEHLPQSDVSLMMKTSKALYAAGLRPLLRHGVTLKNEALLTSFCQFILRDVSTRAPLVRKLYVNYTIESNYDEDDIDEDEDEDDEDADNESEDPPAPSQGLRLLISVLSSTSKLEDLSMDSCEEFLQREKGLFKAITALKSLRRLQLASIEERAAALVDEVKSSLVEIDLFCHSEEADESNNPVPIVKRHAGTLEKLSASYVQLDDLDTQFPKLRALALRVISDFQTATLRQAFPNLKYLELSRLHYGDADELRTENQEGAGLEPWEHLEHLCGDLDALYGLALSPTQVRRVDVLDVSGSEQELGKLHTLLAETSPSRLWLCPATTRKMTPAQLSELLKDPAARTLTHLALDIYDADLIQDNSLLDGLSAMLAPLQITFFVLRSDIDRDRAVAQDFKAAQHGPVAHKLALSSLHLKYIWLDLVDGKTSYWSINRTGENVSLAQLEPMVGRELVRAEGMFFNDRSLGLSAEL
ncbi:hypothetical protein C8Q76DRAFT_244351 [Earliella scabrosa]|nr:hypothetical protein C8Q76DRAFT_244351 [Earliella scabrosa]